MNPRPTLSLVKATEPEGEDDPTGDFEPDAEDEAEDADGDGDADGPELPRARLMRTPRPCSPPAHSPTMAPMTASVTPTLKPPRIDGKAPGISTLDSTCAGRARKARHISRRSASTDRMPTIVATAIGKNTIRLQMITFDS